MDGTLFDSEPAHARAWTGALAEVGIKAPDGADGYVGVADIDIARAAVEQFAPPLAAEMLLAIKNRIYHRVEAPSVALCHGVVEALVRTHAAGIACALVTSGSRDDVEALVGAKGLSGFFEAIISADDVSLLKPHPMPYLSAMELLGREAADCIAIEDSRSGYLSAREAGLRVLVVQVHARPDWCPPETPWFPASSDAIDHAVELLCDAARSASSRRST